MVYVRLVLGLLFVLFVGCSTSSKSVGGGGESFAHNAISIDYKSSNTLNIYDSQPHAISLVVYQLSDINSFNSLKKSKDGIVKLLGAKQFDKSVTSVNKFFVLPNESKKLLIDRASKTVWVGIVAGYYDMQPSRSVLVYKIPEYNAWKFYKSKEAQKFLPIKLYFGKTFIEQR